MHFYSKYSLELTFDEILRFIRILDELVRNKEDLDISPEQWDLVHGIRDKVKLTENY